MILAAAGYEWSVATSHYSRNKIQSQIKLDKWFPYDQTSLVKISKKFNSPYQDWLRQTGRTQSELCQSLNLPSTRMPASIESLKKIITLVEFKNCKSTL